MPHLAQSVHTAQLQRRAGVRLRVSSTDSFRNFILTLAAVFLGAVAIYPELPFGSETFTGPIWILFSSAAFLLTPLRRRREASFFPDPFWMLGVLYILYFPARFAFIYYGSDFTTEALAAHAAVELQGFRALRMATIAGIAIFFGSAITAPPISSLKLVTRYWQGDATHEDIGSWLAIGYFGVIWRIAIAHSMTVWEFSHHGSIGLIFVLLLDAGVVASAAAFAFAREKGQRILAVGLLGANGVAMYQYAFKEPIIMLLLFVFAGWGYRSKKTGWVKLGVLAFLVLFVIFPIVQTLRRSVEQGETASLDSVGSYFDSRLNGREATNHVEMVLASLGRISQRFHGIESMSTVLDRVPEKMPHAGISTIAERFAWTFVPRFFPVDKPQIQQGPMFNREFMGVQSDTPIAIFQIAEAYFVSGPLFLIAIAIFQGWFGRLLSRLRAYLVWERSFPYISMMLWTLMGVERDIVLTWTTLPRTILIFAFVDWFLRMAFARRRRFSRLAHWPKMTGAQTATPGALS